MRLLSRWILEKPKQRSLELEMDHLLVNLNQSIFTDSLGCIGNSLVGYIQFIGTNANR